MFLARAKLLEPEKASIREALGRALFMGGRAARARREFTKAVQSSPPATMPTSRSHSRASGPDSGRAHGGMPSSRSRCGRGARTIGARSPGSTDDRRLGTTALTLADRYDALLFDLDGVLYRGDEHGGPRGRSDGRVRGPGLGSCS